MTTSSPVPSTAIGPGLGLGRADQLFITCLGIFRAVQVVQSALVTVVGHDQYRLWWPVAGAMALVACWSGVLYVNSARLGHVRPSWYAIDAASARSPSSTSSPACT